MFWPLLVLDGLLSSVGPVPVEVPSALALLYLQLAGDWQEWILLNISTSLRINHWPESGFKPTLGRNIWPEVCAILMGWAGISCFPSPRARLTISLCRLIYGLPDAIMLWLGERRWMLGRRNTTDHLCSWRLFRGKRTEIRPTVPSGQERYFSSCLPNSVEILRQL